MNIKAGPLILSAQSTQWLSWLRLVANADQELSRFLKLLESLDINSSEEITRKAISQFIGTAKCPSAPACLRLYFRTLCITALVSDTELEEGYRLLLINLAIEKILSACDGADDRTGDFRLSVKSFLTKSIQLVLDSGCSDNQKVQYLFKWAMCDQCTLIDPTLWWSPMLRTDSSSTFEIAAQLIESLPIIEPTDSQKWKTLDSRWVRMRLKNLLQFSKQDQLLAQLLAKSAIDDTEAAQAVQLLEQLGHGRQALVLAEKWRRILPASNVLGIALVQLYLQDGWDEEALELAKQNYLRNPHAQWLKLLKQSAGNLWKEVAEELNIKTEQDDSKHT